MENETKNIFENGATWLRADFHLHTKADNEFDKKDFEENDFCRLFVEKLKPLKKKLIQRKLNDIKAGKANPDYKIKYARFV